MIAKAKGASPAISTYLLKNETGKLVLHSHGLDTKNAKSINNDFELQRQASTSSREVKKNFYHIVLSHHPDDTEKAERHERQILDDFINELKEKKGIDIQATQFYIVRHDDKKHKHYHIVFNRVSNDGSSMKLDHIGYKVKNVSIGLTKEYNLTPALSKPLRQERVKRNRRRKSIPIGKSIDPERNERREEFTIRNIPYKHKEPSQEQNENKPKLRIR